MIRGSSQLELVRGVASCADGGNASSKSPFRDCSKVVQVGVFFDGTGQNKDHPEEIRRRSHSNIARLWTAHRRDPDKAIYKVYSSGPGTNVDISNPRWWEQLPLSEKVGLGVGFGGDARQQKAEMDLRQAISAVQRVKRIELSVYGFSRGAALARGFVNRILQKCKPDGDGWLLDGQHPIVFKFLGIFDTVASFGLPATNLDEADVRLDIPRCVERVRHFVAAHELRFSFPLDTIRARGKYPAGDRIERVYPGVHSDVGGGYSPEEQGRIFDLGKIICNDMLIECWNAGLPFANKKEIESDKVKMLPLLDYSESSYRLYTDYLASVKAQGTVEAQLLQHTLAYYRYRGLSAKLPDAQEPAYQAMDMRVPPAQAQYRAAALSGRRDLQHTASRNLENVEAQRDNYRGGDRDIAWEAKQLAYRQELSQASPLTRAMIAAGSSGGMPSPAAASQQTPLSADESRMLKAWQDGLQGRAPTPESKFFEAMVHDSKAHFLTEPTGYFRSRGVYQSNFVPVDQRPTAVGQKRAGNGR
jgi:hypothetical protein